MNRFHSLVLALTVCLSPYALAQPITLSPNLIVEDMASISTSDYALLSIAMPPSTSPFDGYLYFCGLATDPVAEDVVWRMDMDTGEVEVYALLSAESDPVTIDFAPEGTSFDPDQIYICANNADGFLGGDCGGAMLGVSFTSDPVVNPPIVTPLTGATSTPCGPGTLMQLTEPSGFVFDPGAAPDGAIHVLNSSDSPDDLVSVRLLGPGSADVSVLYSDGLSGVNCTSAAGGICASSVRSVLSTGGAYGSRTLYFVQVSPAADGAGIYSLEVPIDGPAPTAPSLFAAGFNATVARGPDPLTGQDTLWTAADGEIQQLSPTGLTTVWGTGFDIVTDFAPTMGAMYLVDRGAGIVYRVRATGAAFTRGDCNQDLGLDIADPVRVLNVLFAGASTPNCDDACDTNDDGTLNIADPVYALSFLFSGGLALPAPVGTCGDDPTADGLGCVTFSACP